MDADRFDALAKGLATFRDRRWALTALLALMSGTLTQRLLPAAERKKRKRQKPRRKGDRGHAVQTSGNKRQNAKKRKKKRRSNPAPTEAPCTYNIYDQSNLPITQCTYRYGDCTCSAPEEVEGFDVSFVTNLLKIPAFHKSCLKHDECFTTCGTTVEECGNRFLADLTAACANPITALTTPKCLEFAAGYYAAVMLTSVAQTEHAKAQRAVCCALCPANEGAQCFAGRCCGDLVCQRGVCVSQTCAPTSAACTSADQCCEGACENGFCHGGTSIDYDFPNTLLLPWCSGEREPRRLTQDWDGHDSVGIALDFGKPPDDPFVYGPPPPVKGTLVLAPMGGTVERNPYPGSTLGKHVLIDAGNGWGIILAHLDEFDADLPDPGPGEPPARVNTGDVIGTLGGSGASGPNDFVPHIHLDLVIADGDGWGKPDIAKINRLFGRPRSNFDCSEDTGCPEGHAFNSGQRRCMATPPGELYELVGGWGSYGYEDGQFMNPRGIAVDTDGIIYVADTGNYRIQRFRGDGEHVDTGYFGMVGDGSPQDLAIDDLGNVYIAREHGIYMYDREGIFVRPFRGSSGFTYEAVVDSLTVDKDGYVYGVAQGSRVHIWHRRDGLYVGRLGEENGGVPLDFNQPWHVAVNNDSGHLYVVERGTHRVRKLTLSGIEVASWGSFGTEEGEFNNPGYIAIDRDWDVYVADFFYGSTRRIQKFSANGTYLGAWTVAVCNGIDVDAAGFVYTTDWYNSRVQVFAPASEQRDKMAGNAAAQGTSHDGRENHDVKRGGSSKRRKRKRRGKQD
jgi:DNA-binding beta-propeller fold protein YncE